MRSLRALICDFGDVLTNPQPPELVARMAAVAGVQVSSFEPVYWRLRDRYHVDISAERYWDAVFDGIRSPLSEAERRAALPRLRELDIASWTSYREEAWAIPAAFKDGGGRTALLSNAVPDVIARWRNQRRLERYFEVQVVSCEVGCAKPAPAIYRIVLDRLQVEPGAALFVDDREENLVAARAAGLRTFHFVGDGAVAALREQLALAG